MIHAFSMMIHAFSMIFGTIGELSPTSNPEQILDIETVLVRFRHESPPILLVFSLFQQIWNFLSGLFVTKYSQEKTGCCFDRKVSRPIALQLLSIIDLSFSRFLQECSEVLWRLTVIGIHGAQNFISVVTII